MSFVKIKDPDAVLPFTFGWSGWLDGDTIADGEIIADGVTVDDTVNDDTTVTVWLSGGVDRSRATVTCRITTAGGLTDDRTLHLLIQER